MQDVRQKVEPYRELSIGVKEVRQIKLTGDYKYLVVLSADKVCVFPKGELKVAQTFGGDVLLEELTQPHFRLTAILWYHMKPQ